MHLGGSPVSRLGKLLRLVSVFALIFLPSVAFGSDLGIMSDTSLGFATPTALSGTPATNAIRMGGVYGYYTRLTLVMTVVWGTTTAMDVSCKVSGNGTDYGYIQRCTSAAVHDCANRVWEWVPADGTTFALDFETNYPYTICEFTGTGTGTITAHAIRGR